jgi:hypothetical protein
MHNGRDLYAWTNSQRASYKKAQSGKIGALPARRIAKLKSIGFLFDLRQENWDIMFEGLAAYHVKHGTFPLPLRGIIHNGKNLGSWAATQRKAYKIAQQRGAPEAGENGGLSQLRIHKLKAIGFSFDGKQHLMISSDCNNCIEATMGPLGHLHDLDGDSYVNELGIDSTSLNSEDATASYLLRNLAQSSLQQPFDQSTMATRPTETTR